MATILIPELTEATAVTGTDTYELDNGTSSRFATHDTLKTFVNAGQISQASTVTRTVGSGGDFSTINAALEDLTEQFPIYRANSVEVIIQLLTGFQMSEQVLLRHGVDLGFVRIQSVDAEVTIVRSALTDAVDNQSVFPAFGGFNSVIMPAIDCIFNMDSSGTATGRDGIYVSTNCEAVVLPDQGIRNAGGTGCSIQRGSRASVHEGIFTGAGDNGIEANRCSRIDASQCDVSGAINVGIFAQRASLIDAPSTANASGCGTGVQAQDGSTINVNNVNASGATSLYGLYSLNSSKISAASCNASNAAVDGCRVQSASTAFISNGTLTGAGGRGVYALQGSTISAQSVNASGAVTNGCAAIAGSRINFVGGNGQIVGAPGSDDIDVLQGSIIAANNATGGTSQTVNTLTTNGVIFG